MQSCDSGGSFTGKNWQKEAGKSYQANNRGRNAIANAQQAVTVTGVVKTAKEVVKK